MEYSITVSLIETHRLVFTTTTESAPSTYQYLKLVALLKDKFPESDGYKVTATRWETTKTPIDENGRERPSFFKGYKTI